MPKTKKNRRKNLSVPSSCKRWFEEYTNYLGLQSRIIQVDEIEIKSKADFLRHLIYQYGQYLRWNLPADQPTPAQESLEVKEEYADIPCYLTKQAEDLWDSLIREGFVLNYSQLATYALWYAWENHYRKVQKIKERAKFWEVCSHEIILEEVAANV